MMFTLSQNVFAYFRFSCQTNDPRNVLLPMFVVVVVVVVPLPVVPVVLAAYKTVRYQLVHIIHTTILDCGYKQFWELFWGHKNVRISYLHTISFG